MAEEAAVSYFRFHTFYRVNADILTFSYNKSATVQFQEIDKCEDLDNDIYEKSID